MPKISSGLLMYRKKDEKIEVFLVHHGGPFWKNKDKRAWSIPKGIVEEKEDNISAAKREFEEETGIKPDAKKFIPLGYVQQKSGKIVHAWAFEKDFNGKIRHNMIRIRWPPKIGKEIEIPEVDKGEFFDIDTAKEKIIAAQEDFICRLLDYLKKN